MSFPTSQKLLLVVVSNFVGALLVVAQEHICSSIMSGKFEKMQIRSITFDTDTTSNDYGDANGLLIFQSDGRTYSVPIDNIKEDHMNLANVPVGSYNIDGRFARAYKTIKGNKLEKLYHFRKRAEDQSSDADHLTQAYMMFTERDNQIHLYREYEKSGSVYTWNVTQEKFPIPIVLVHNQKGRTCHTYAINRDVYDGSGDYVIYQVWMNSPDYKPVSFQVRNPPDEMKIANATSRFYYLEITDDSSVAMLVHRKNVHNRQLGAQMFSDLPHGFLHRKSNEMYLFDMDLGCVYHFTEWREEKLWERWADGKNIVTKRKNYPFEEYFKCDPAKFPKSKDFPHKRERCNTTIHNHIYTTSKTSTTTAKYSELTSGTDSAKPSIQGLVFSGIGALILFIVIGLIFLVKKGKPAKKSTKSAKSKSSLGGKSQIKSGGQSSKMSQIASSTPSQSTGGSVVYKIPSNVKSSFSITAKSTTTSKTGKILLRSKTSASPSPSSKPVKMKSKKI